MIPCPANTAAVPHTTLRIAYSAAICALPPFIKSPVSSAKEEKVVKPPHIPAFKNKTVLGLSQSVFIASAAMIPMRKDPAILIKNVFIGNAHPS